MAEADVVGVRVIGRYQGQNIVSTIHYLTLTQTVADHDTLQILTDAWSASLSAAWLARHIDSYSLIGIKGFSVTGDNKRPGLTEVSSPGLVSGEEVPSSVNRVITLYTDSENHWRRGRVMLSGGELSMFDTTDGSVAAAERINLATLGDILIDPIASDEESWSACLPAGTGVGGAYPVEQFTAMMVRKTPACIRSRRVRGFSIG